jgi:hypothetical protein
MTRRDRLWHLRLPADLCILGPGLAKRDADEETATSLHGLAAGTYLLSGDRRAAAGTVR